MAHKLSDLVGRRVRFTWGSPSSPSVREGVVEGYADGLIFFTEGDELELLAFSSIEVID